MPKMFSIHYDKNIGTIKVIIDNNLIIDYECYETYDEFRDVLDSVIIMAKHNGFMYEIIADGDKDDSLVDVVRRGHFKKCD